MSQENNSGDILQAESKHRVWVRQVPNLISNTPVDRGLNLSWNSVKNANYYTVFYKQNGSANFTKVSTTAETNYTISDLFSLDHVVKSSRTSLSRDALLVLAEPGFNEQGCCCTIKCIACAASAEISSEVAAGFGLKISWLKANGANGYRLD